jgi:hypothetical protein
VKRTDIEADNLILVYLCRFAEVVNDDNHRLYLYQEMFSTIETVPAFYIDLYQHSSFDRTLYHQIQIRKLRRPKK